MINVHQIGPCMSSGELQRRMNRDIRGWFHQLINTYRDNHRNCLCLYRDAEILAYQLHLYARKMLLGISIMFFYDDYVSCIKSWLQENNIAPVYQEHFLSQSHFVRSWSVRDSIPSPNL